jgi:hypothetical protein
LELSALAHYGTIASISAASVLLIYQLIRQRMSPARTIGTFGFLVLFLIFGWLIVELFETIAGEAIAYLAGLVHFLMMLVFAIGITLNWRRSSQSP